MAFVLCVAVLLCKQLAADAPCLWQEYDRCICPTLATRHNASEQPAAQQP